MINDHLSDFLTRIRNAGMARKVRVDVHSTKMNKRVAEILVKEGYLKHFKEVQAESKNFLRLFLKYESGDVRKPVIRGLKRESRPGLRRYVGVDGMPKVMSGFGLAIISTSKGILTDRQAKKENTGGEYLCSVW